jgi:hypothetical protein
VGSLRKQNKPKTANRVIERKGSNRHGLIASCSKLDSMTTGNNKSQLNQCNNIMGISTMLNMRNGVGQSSHPMVLSCRSLKGSNGCISTFSSNPLCFIKPNACPLVPFQSSFTLHDYCLPPAAE